MALKLKKLPKRPKASASLASWESYERKVDAVIKHNAEQRAAQKKKEALIGKINQKIQKTA
jgi:hypothetical protein